MRAQLLKGTGGFYEALAEDGRRYTLRARGNLRHRRLTPIIGDYIEITPGEGETHGWLEDIYPRENRLLRPDAANVEVLLLTVAAVPSPDLLLIDRLVLHARASGIECLICANKTDLDGSFGDSVKMEYRRSCSGVFPVSALYPDTLGDLRNSIANKAACFAGQSGVGKSALISALTGKHIATGEISKKIERGKHTTRHVELLVYNGLRIFDTPGFSLLEPADIAPAVVFLASDGAAFITGQALSVSGGLTMH